MEFYEKCRSNLTGGFAAGSGRRVGAPERLVRVSLPYRPMIRRDGPRIRHHPELTGGRLGRRLNARFSDSAGQPAGTVIGPRSGIQSGGILKSNKTKVFGLNSKDLGAIEDRAIKLVENLVWPQGPVCPHCNHEGKVYRLTGKTSRPGLRKCAACRKQFTVRVGTIFEGSHIPLSKWLIAIYMMCTYPNGVSASQLQRALDISYKSAWFLCQRVRYAKTRPPLRQKLQAKESAMESMEGEAATAEAEPGQD